MRKIPRTQKILEPVNIYGFIAVFIAMSTVGLGGVGLNYSDAYREAIAEVGFVGLLLFWFFQNRKKDAVELNITASRILFAALFLLGTISVFWAANFNFFINKYLIWVGAAAVFLLALSVKTEVGQYIKIARGVVFIGSYVAVIGLIQALTSLEIFTQSYAPAANFVNKNMASQVIVFTFPLTVFLFFTDKKLSFIYPFIAAAMLGFLSFTTTRGAWIAVFFEIILIAAALIFHHMKSRRDALRKNHEDETPSDTKARIKKIVLIVIPIGLLVTVLFAPTVGGGKDPVWEQIIRQVENTLGEIKGQTLEDERLIGKGNPRIFIWEETIDMAQDNPVIGTGLGSFYHNTMVKYTTMVVTIGPIRVHNDVLEMVVELGLVGGILFLLVMVSLVRDLFKSFAHKDPSMRLFYLMAGATLAGGFVNMQFSFPYQLPVPTMLTMLYSGLIVKASDPFKTSLRQWTLKLRPKNWSIIFSAFAVIFIFVLTVNSMWLRTFSILNDNLVSGRWGNPLVTPFSCSKPVVKAMSISIKNNTPIPFALGILESINACVPNTWQYHSQRGALLMRQKKYPEALALIEVAKKIKPFGHYSDYTNQFVAYLRLGDRQKAAQVYEEMSKEPLRELRQRSKTWDFLIRMALDLGKMDDAKKFYKMHEELFSDRFALRHRARLKKLIKQFDKPKKTNNKTSAKPSSAPKISIQKIDPTKK